MSLLSVMANLLFPEAASTIADDTDRLFLTLVAFSVIFTAGIVGGTAYLAVRYRRRAKSEVPPVVKASWLLEVTWIGAAVVVSIAIFTWGASIYFRIARPPADATEIFVLGRQWMWKFQHRDGRREINELHVPVGRPVKLILTSEDVIHDLFIPAFRVKVDVLPGKYTQLWFEATKAGSYRLFCAEYCGTKHSQMVGQVVALEPRAYEEWLSGAGEAGAATQPSTGSLADAGRRIFASLGCATCHAPAPEVEARGRGPSLAGLFGKEVELADGRTVRADESYIRESIIDPGAKLVAGYQPLMPSFRGVVDEEGLIALLAYIRSLNPPAPAAAPPATTAPERPSP